MINIKRTQIKSLNLLYYYSIKIRTYNLMKNYQTLKLINVSYNRLTELLDSIEIAQVKSLTRLKRNEILSSQKE